MNRNSIICQCNVDPSVFFYFSGRSFHRKLGLYLTNDFASESIIQTTAKTSKSKLSFTPVVTEISDSIFSEELSLKNSFQFFPSFSWYKNNTVGVFTTGFSREIKIFNLSREQSQVSERIDIPNHFCSSLDLNSNGSFNLLASSNIKHCNVQSITEGHISIIDINTKQNIVNFHRRSGPNRVYNCNEYPNNVKWVDSNCLVSGWRFCDSSNQIRLNDIRAKDSMSVLNVLTNCNEFLSVSKLENYLLSSNLNNIIKVFDIRFIKNELGSNVFQPVTYIYFNDNEIIDTKWFPYEKRAISIFTRDGIFIVSLDNMHSKFCFEGTRSDKYSENFEINWNEALLENFKSINLEEDFNDTFCWVNSNFGNDKNYSLVFTTPDAAYLMSNLDVEFNPAPSCDTIHSHSTNSHNKLQIKYEVLSPPKLLGYSWIPYRIIKYYKNDNTRIEEFNYIELLRKLENLNSKEAQNLVVNQGEQNILGNMGVFPQSKHSLANIIKMIKSASHAFNYLSTLPNKITFWKELLMQFNEQNSEFSKRINILDKLIIPSIRELVYILKGESWYSEISTQLKFIDIKLDDLECSNYEDLKRENIHQIEIFSSPVREKLILLFGVSSFVIEERIFINNNDQNKLESFLISFFWNCVTLQYQHFISHGDKLSSILDIFIDNEYKLLKTSFLKNIKLFFNSAGIFISNLYYSEELNKICLSGKDIQFYYYSIISTSEHLLDEDYYLPIWNSNTYLESTIQLSIRFIVAFSKFLSKHDRSKQFSTYLLEELLLPSMEINSYIYIPANLLLLIGVYYLPLEDIYNLIEIIIRKMAKNGFLDGISILGFSTFVDETYYMVRNAFDISNSEYPGGVIGYLNSSGNTNPALLDSDNNSIKNINHNYSSQTLLKLIFQKYLSLSCGDIQTVALIGSCIPENSSNTGTKMELLKTCITEYRNLLKNNSLIGYLINDSNPMNLSINGSKTTKMNGVSSLLYELNILRSCYCKFISQDQDKLNTPLPTGNVLFCYYCEQPLFQAYFEQNFLFDKNVPSSDCSLVVSQSFKTDMTELQTEKKELLNKHNRDSQVGHVFCRTNKNIPGVNAFIQHEINPNLDLSSIILNCPNKFCNKALPRCVICLTEMSIGIISASIKDDNSQKDCNQQSKNSNLGKWYTWCLHCHHGGCFKHICEWFECFDECPVPECNCWCNAVDKWYKI